MKSSAYPTFSKAIEHLNKQTKLIVNGVSSVSETENSEGVVFTLTKLPHLFFLHTWMKRIMNYIKY